MPCKQGVAGSIPGSSQSAGWDLKPWLVFWDALKPEPLPVEPSGAPGHYENHKKHKPIRPVLVIAKEHGHTQENYVSGSICQGAPGLIPGFSQSVRWDFKPWPRFLRRFKIRTTVSWAFAHSSSNLGPLSAGRSSKTLFRWHFASEQIVARLIVLTGRVLLDIKTINPSCQYWL